MNGNVRTNSNSAWSGQQRLLYAGIPVTVAFQPANEALLASLWDYLEGIDAVFNDHRDDSEIGRINAGGGGAFGLSEPLATAFACAERLQRLTGGAFSITTGPLRRLWRQASLTGMPPAPDASDTVLAALAPAAWRRDGNTLHVFHPGVRFDFGGLIKGLAVDHVMRQLLDHGVAAAFVQCGGETACHGLSRRGRPHVLGIPDPEAPDVRLWCTIRDPGGGLSASTSANYRNAYTIAGRSCHHIFDPRSGLPANTDILSVSVVIPHCGWNGVADALATAGTVLGWRGLFPIVTAQGGAALALVREGGGVAARTTDGWRDLTC